MSKEEERRPKRERKPYSAPRVEGSRTFETLAMACGKAAPNDEFDLCNGGTIGNS